MDRTACTEPQCLYKGALYLYLLFLKSTVQNKDRHAGKQRIIKSTWCGRKVMRLATLCTNRQCWCLPLHMAVRLTPAVDSVQVSTCYSSYAIVESVWSEVVFVRCVTKMDRQKFEQRCAIKFCVKLGESATVTYENLQGLMENIPYPGHKCSDGTSPF